MPGCYFAEPCGWCFPQRVDQALSAVAVTARETKRLMDAHVRFGHRNFRSLAKALNMRMPSKIPFCQACVEAKSTRHPKSITPRPLREPAPRPGYRLHFDLSVLSPRGWQTGPFMACYLQMPTRPSSGSILCQRSKTGFPA